MCADSGGVNVDCPTISFAETFLPYKRSLASPSGRSVEPSSETPANNPRAREFVEFVVDRNTKVNGQVKEGTAVTIEYQAMESGQNLAVNITAQA